MSPDEQKNPRFLTPGRERLALLFLLVLAGLLYLPGLNGPFLHDDFGRIVKNERVAAERLDLPSLMRSTLEYPQRPLAMVTFAANHATCGTEPVCYKSTNVLLHLATGFALWLFLGQLCRAGRRRRLFMAPDWLPLAVTALWLLHPLNVSTVLYAVQRMTQMATLFSLLAMSAWLRARQAGPGGAGRVGWLLAAALCLLLGVLSKESAWLTIPLVALVELLLLAPAYRQRIAHPVLAGWGLATAGLITLWLLAEYPPQLVHGSYLTRDFTPTERLLTEARILMYYVSEVFYPDPQRMSIFLDTFGISRSIVSPIATLPAVAACVLAIGASLAALLRRPSLVAFGVLFFFVGHALESSIIGLVLAYEHRNYLPAIGLLIAVIALLPGLPSRLAWLQPGTVGVATAVLLLTLSSRVGIWATEDAFTEALRSPRWENSYGANVNIARHAASQHKKHFDDPMLARVYQNLTDKHFLMAARATSQPFLPLANLVARPASALDTEMYWQMLYDAARDAPLNMDALNATTWMAVCLLAPECPISRKHFAAYMDLILANPRQPNSTRRRMERVAGTFFTRVYGDEEKGLSLSRQAASSGDPGARESLIKNLGYAGRTAEAMAEYRALQAAGTLDRGQMMRIEAAIANPGIALP